MKVEASMRKKPDGKAQGFGKRGHEKAAPAEAAPTSMERLMRMGKRWLGKKEPPKKKVFKRPSLGT
jgi:hypothetical protein